MTDLMPEDARAADRWAKDKYKAEHPEPSALDFRCPQCKAEPGLSYPGRPENHDQREARADEARSWWEYDAINHSMNLWYERLDDAKHRAGIRCTTDNHLKYMRRFKARIRKPGEPSGATFGAWLSAHRAEGQERPALVLVCECGRELSSALNAFERVYAATGETWTEERCPSCGQTYTADLRLRAATEAVAQ